MNVLDLFSGIGGFSLGLERAGMKTVAFCEIEEFPRKVLAKHWPDVPIYEDVRELSRDRLESDGVSRIDVICGGFPCQDISVAGKKVGISGARSSLWAEFARLIGEIRPRFAIVENSAALIHRGLGELLGDLAALGYDAEWHCIPAAALAAPHGRDRCWIVANPNSNCESTSAVDDEARRVQATGGNDATDAQRGQQPLGWVLEGVRRQWESVAGNGIWEIENSPIGMGVDDGVPARMDRLRALGNAVVPQIPELIGKAIMEVA